MYFKLKKLAESKLAITMAGPQPQAAIEARIAELNIEGQITERHVDFMLSMNLLMALISFFATITYAAKHLKPAFSWGCLFETFGVLFVSMALFWLMLDFVIKLSRVVSSLDAERSGLQPMARKHCQELIDCCEAHAECEAYRDAVIKQGRKFIAAEFKMLVAHAKTLKEKAACNELYETLTVKD
ncbi:nitrogen fixation protein FixH [Novimethylophilus kurashikiensis]|uniref:Nitrogen fixation protein FixH n=1 Tax=Novimethylophilus kurashikiensis TaxID=1825523 RepID=A0A2R5FAJ2_9PROT|nr:hypothetical protein [Novimethylophilus kurashikiensis]GBG14568.1 nitrogen fixation protein FixH [Novimethylophilus kurashikiensis]